MNKIRQQTIDTAKAFLSSNQQLIEQQRPEQAIRDNFTSYLRQLFPDEPSWVRRHISDTESAMSIVTARRRKTGFVDNLVDLTAIEYEQNLLSRAKFDGGFRQVKEYCSSLINAGNRIDQILGVLSDTIRWFAYSVSVRESAQSHQVTPDDVILTEIESIDLSAANDRAAIQLIEFLTRYLGRLGSRRLNAATIAFDMGFESPFGSGRVQSIRTLVERAFSERPGYADLIRTLWSNFVGYLTTESGNSFDSNSYISELYILTLAKLICANVIERRGLLSDDAELDVILNGDFFKQRGLSNLVEYDYFGWLNAAPYVDDLRPVARLIQQDLRAYDFAQTPQEDVFGRLMAQLANRTQRILLGQEFTPAWLAREIVTETVNMLPANQPPRLVDMCCGSGAMIAETLRIVQSKLTEEEKKHKDAVLEKLIQSITGFDIDPLAVLLSKTTWVVSVRDWITDLPNPINIPVYHADSLFAITPLSNTLLDEESTNYFVLNVLGQRLTLPQYLLQPSNQTLFDSLLDFAYDLALQTPSRGKPNYNQELVKQGVIRTMQQSDVQLTPAQVDELGGVFYALTVRIDELNRAGNNGIWAFILRNSYRPSLVAGQFNGLVSNPPWLSMSKIARNPYQAAVSRIAERYNIKPSGSSHPHIEMATIFLIHAVGRYLENNAVVGCIVPETVLNGHHHNRFRKRSYESAQKPVSYHLTSIWEVDPEAVRFKNKAIVLFGRKEKLDTYPISIDGKYVTRGSSTPLKYYWNEQGQRAIWSKNPPSSSANGFFKPANFEQGADILPRNLFLVDIQPVQGTGTSNLVSVSSINRQTSKYGFSMSDIKKFKTFSLRPTVILEDFLFDVLTSNHLLPFEVALEFASKAVLPLKRETEGWKLFDLVDIRAQHRNSFTVFQQIQRAIQEDNPSKDIAALIDYRSKLTKQRFGRAGYLVLTGAGGGVTCSAYLPMAQLNINQLIIDQTLYWAQVDSEDEALYLTGLFNSDALLVVIGDFVPQGAFGGRHQHTLPFGVTPKYDPSDAAHQDVVAKTRLLLQEYQTQKSSSPKVMTALDPNSGRLPFRRPIIKNFIKTLPSYHDYELSCRSLYGV